MHPSVRSPLKGGLLIIWLSADSQITGRIFCGGGDESWEPHPPRVDVQSPFNGMLSKVFSFHFGLYFSWDCVPCRRHADQPTALIYWASPPSTTLWGRLTSSPDWTSGFYHNVGSLSSSSWEMLLSSLLMFGTSLRPTLLFWVVVQGWASVSPPHHLSRMMFLRWMIP